MITIKDIIRLCSAKLLKDVEFVAGDSAFRSIVVENNIPYFEVTGGVERISRVPVSVLTGEELDDNDEKVGYYVKLPNEKEEDFWAWYDSGYGDDEG